MKKQVVYTLGCETEKEIKKVERLKNRLYDKYNSVIVCPNGLYEVKIVCEDKIK